MSKKILVVEDSPSSRELLFELLRGHGHEVHEAEEGNQALRKAKELRPDLMILDVMLPNRSGFEICSELKEDPKYREIRIILLTGITQGSDKGDEYWRQKAHADEFVSKPLNIQDLLQRVERLLEEPPPAPR